MHEFVITFVVRKGLGPDTSLKTICVGLDDVPEELSFEDIKQMAIADAEHQLRQLPDYQLYRENWTFHDIERV